ncbi:hypothetical protein PAHAL_5G184600 [Panicum hallii]|uniref:Uncharacterized protein n=1 Tax=Panicum hallii TaxID=206008 RepID=A0A2S3HSV4_9POAL|nr:nucleosome assembly protein 1;2-like isoform X1 [Panicum hallii]PAN28895.1 hypothetical protein PAHAL_5G184600 [Panicum hallii]
MTQGGDALDLASKAELTPEQKAALVMSLKNKLEGLVAQHTDVLESLAPKVRKRVDVLRAIQSKHDELEAKFIEERTALEAKYLKLYEPLYSKRSEIVTGVVEVDGITKGGDETPAEPKEKGVPDFWLNAMKNNEILAEEIQKRDEEALKYLKNIEWCRIDDPKGFKIVFSFDANPFFKNSVLTKTYHMIDEDDPILEKAIGTEIEWYPGKCLTKRVLQKKPKKGSKDTKPIIMTQERKSFFNFFNPPQVPDVDEKIDEDTAVQLQDQMEQDYDIGSAIREKIIPHAVSWFTGEAQDEDYDGTILEDDENNSEDEEDDYDEDDEEDEEDE